MPPTITPKPTVMPSAGGVSVYRGPGSTIAAPPTPTNPGESLGLPTIAVVGDSGQGKSYSLLNMPWEYTALIDTERKDLPFDRSKVKYHYACKSAGDVENRIDALKANPGPIRYVVIDSLYMYMDILLAECMACYKNYDIYNNYNSRLRELLHNKIKDPNLIFICIAQPELVTIVDDNGKNASRIRIYTFGNQHEGKIERQFLAVFYATTQKDATTGKIKYLFRTNTDGINSAKSPPNWFGDTLLVPNDLAAILKIVDKNFNPTNK